MVTHGVALAFEVIFIVLAVTFGKMVWWIVSLGYTIVLAWFAIINVWEVLFFIPLFGFGIISIIGFIYSALNGEII